LEVDGVSGREESVSRLIAKHIKKYVDKLYSDKVGNLIAIKKGKEPKIMLASHMDEVGLIVKMIDDDGLVGLAEVGGLNVPSIVNQRVEIVGKTRVPGVISTRSISNDWDFEREKNLIMHDLFVDTGLEKKELEKKGVMIGSTVVLKQHNGFLANQKIVYGKALDDRTGCFILCELAKRLKGIPNEVILVFTVQEEVGLYGAKVSIYNLQPDYCLVVDTSNANDRMNETPTKVLGKGPVLTVMDVEMLGNRKLNEKLEALAKKKKIPLQPEVSSAGTTDALSIAFSKGGIPTSMIGVAVRNLHTTVGMSHLDDIENCVELLASFLKEKRVF
jgi:endoglucanase